MSDLPTADPNAEEVADGPANYGVKRVLFC